MNDSSTNNSRSAVERAEQWGIDVSLLRENLKLSPVERLRISWERASNMSNLRRARPVK